MFIEKEYFIEWMERMMNRFDKIEKTLDRIENQARYFEGEKTFDNEQLCHFLKVSKRTLQRYRSSKLLKFHAIHKKFYYKESDVYDFIGKYFSNNKADDASENEGDSNTESGIGEQNGEGVGEGAGDDDVVGKNGDKVARVNDDGRYEGVEDAGGGREVEGGGEQNDEGEGTSAGDDGDVERE